LAEHFETFCYSSFILWLLNATLDPAVKKNLQKRTRKSMLRRTLAKTLKPLTRTNVFATRFLKAEAPAAEAATKSAAKSPAETASKQTNEQIEALNLKIQKQQTELAELKDAYVRTLAESENVRKRAAKEIKEKQEYAIQKFAKDLLPTADVLTLALDAVPESQRGELATDKNLKNLYIGVDMTRKSLIKTFSEYGIVGYHPMGHKFDFNLHTAIFQSPMKDMESGTIFHVDKIGYKIKDRVLRSAQVGVVQE
jgi:molecular chaperone GrpE